MKIAYCVPGTGGAFYCENCIRDGALITGLRKLGHEVTVIPLYLPVNSEEGLGEVTTPIAFGAIRVYLEEKFPLLRRLPERVLGALDAPALIGFASSLAGSTRAAGHERLTLAMLDGETGSLKGEFERFSRWIAATLKPDVLFISNALLLGVTSAVKAVSKITTVCIAQDEHTWVDTADPLWRSNTWKRIAEKCDSVDVLVSMSGWYAGKLSRETGLPLERISIVPFGVDPSRYRVEPQATHPLRIGYLSRLDRQNGVGTLIDAFCILAGRMGGEKPELRLCGGHTRDDLPFLDGKLAAARRSGVVSVYPDFGIGTRREFLSGLSALSVPVNDEIAFGTFLVEAWACGVPVVQPDQGGFGELVRTTGAGVLHAPGSAEALADKLQMLLQDNRQRAAMGARGGDAVASDFNNVNMAQTVIGLVQTKQRTTGGSR